MCTSKFSLQHAQMCFIIRSINHIFVHVTYCSNCRNQFVYDFLYHRTGHKYVVGWDIFMNICSWLRYFSKKKEYIYFHVLNITRKCIWLISLKACLLKWNSLNTPDFESWNLKNLVSKGLIHVNRCGIHGIICEAHFKLQIPLNLCQHAQGVWHNMWRAWHTIRPRNFRQRAWGG